MSSAFTSSGFLSFPHLPSSEKVSKCVTICKSTESDAVTLEMAGTRCSKYSNKTRLYVQWNLSITVTHGTEQKLP